MADDEEFEFDAEAAFMLVQIAAIDSGDGNVFVGLYDGEGEPIRESDLPEGLFSDLIASPAWSTLIGIQASRYLGPGNLKPNPDF